MDLLCCASDLNHQGAVALSQGDSSALTLLQGALVAIEGVCDQTQLLFAESIEPESLQYSMLCNAVHSKKVIDQLRNAGCYILSKPFVFATPGPVSMPSIRGYKAMIVYNMALAYHCLGTCNSGGCSASAMKAAEELYDFCLHLFAELNDPTVFSNLLVAVLNNKAQIHFCQHNFKLSRLILDKLGTVLRSTTPSRLALHDEDIDGVITNVSCQFSLAGASAA